MKRLGNTEIRDLVHQIDNAIRMRLLANSNNDITSVNIVRPLAFEPPSSAELKSYANSWFNHAVNLTLKLINFQATLKLSIPCFLFWIDRTLRE